MPNPWRRTSNERARNRVFLPPLPPPFLGVIGMVSAHRKDVDARRERASRAEACFRSMIERWLQASIITAERHQS
jgi:hypothetical protein